MTTQARLFDLPPLAICFVCGKPIADDDERHECHGPGCKRSDCDCDYPAHEACCPDCNPAKRQGVKW